MRRRCALPVLLMAPRRTRSPLESSRGTPPLYPISCRGFRNRDSDPTSLTMVAADTLAIPRSLQRLDHRPQARRGRLDGHVNGSLQPPDALTGVLDLGQMVDQHRLLRRRLDVHLAPHPLAMLPGPGLEALRRAPAMPTQALPQAG